MDKLLNTEPVIVQCAVHAVSILSLSPLVMGMILTLMGFAVIYLQFLCLKMIWWDCVKDDMESLGLSQKDVQFRNKWRRRIKGATG